MIHHDTCIALCCNVSAKDIEWYRSPTSHFTTYAWLGSSTRRWDLQSCPFVMMRRFETRFGTWFAPQLYRKTLIRPEWHSMRRIIKNQSISQTPWSTLKPLEMDTAVQFQHNGWTPSEVVLHGRWSLATVPSRKTRELASQPETLQPWWWRGGLSRRMEHQWYSCEILPHSVACHWEFLFRASWSCS